MNKEYSKIPSSITSTRRVCAQSKAITRKVAKVEKVTTEKGAKGSLRAINIFKVTGICADNLDTCNATAETKPYICSIVET